MTDDDQLSDLGPPLLLTVVQAGELTGLSRSSIYGLVRAGRLPIVHPVGRSARIPRAAVEAFVTELVVRAKLDPSSPQLIAQSRPACRGD
jgi:excisionase family DNA binding protein